MSEAHINCKAVTRTGRGKDRKETKAMGMGLMYPARNQKEKNANMVLVKGEWNSIHTAFPPSFQKSRDLLKRTDFSKNTPIPLSSFFPQSTPPSISQPDAHP